MEPDIKIRNIVFTEDKQAPVEKVLEWKLKQDGGRIGLMVRDTSDGVWFYAAKIGQDGLSRTSYCVPLLDTGMADDDGCIKDAGAK